MEQNSPHHLTHILRRILVLSALVVIAFAAGAAAWLFWRIRVCLPQLEGVVHVLGLKGRVEVLRDALGVPHLRAESLDDLLLAQGYVTAQDRLWQMDLTRRLAQGALSEVFGERTLRLDIENRTLGLREVCDRAVGELDPDSRGLFAAYARGVNAFISSHLDRLPLEFLILGYQPRPWQEADSCAVALNMVKMLSASWPQDLMRERVRAKVSSELYADLFPEHSPLDHPVAEPLPARTPAPAAQRLSAVRDPDEICPLPALLAPPPEPPPPGLGSNDWVVSGSRTASGKPLLANDPHLGHSVPSVWYMIHLKAPRLDVSGVSFPGMPTVILGHNARIAWGVTNTGSDVQDLYVENFNFRDPDKYLHNGNWVDAVVREESIRVRGGRNYTFAVKTTRHGPIVSHDGDRDLALRWTALEPHALHAPFWKINQARNWQEFVSALRDFAVPMLNFVYADVDGNIGYYAPGRIPIRPRGDGTVPSPGSTDEYDWSGYIPFEDLPHAFNPASGIIATANGRVVPDGYPYFLTKRWESPYRTARIFQLLASSSRFTVQDMLRIQTDIHSLEDLWLAKKLVAAGAQHPTRSAEAREAVRRLASWDGEARIDSAETLVCEMARHALLERILQPKLGEDLSGYDWPMSTVFLENVLSNDWPRWLPPGDADFNVTLIESLEEGIHRIEERLGTRDLAAWQWGDTIALTFRHPLGSLPLLGHWLNTGPFPQSGTQTTVKQVTPTVGPSMRLVVDFSEFDNSVQNITLGQSGQVFSPHFRDQFDAWYRGRSFPMLFSDSAVEKGAAHRLVLEPGG